MPLAENCFSIEGITIPSLNHPTSSRPFLVSFLAVSSLFALELIFLSPFFNTNDDVWSLLTSKGVGISFQPDEHLQFNNVILGFLLKWLYTLFPEKSWFSLYLLVVQFISFWAILAAALLKAKSRFPVLLFVLGFGFIGVYFFLQLNYTMASILAFQGGIFLWASTASGNNRQERRTIPFLSSICLVISAITRLDAFLFSAFLAFPFMATTLRNEKKKTHLIKIVCWTGIVIGLCLGFDHFYYRQDPNWREYLQSYSDVANLQANKTEEYNAQTKPFFDKVGWTRNDLDMFTSWYFWDQQKYNSQIIQKLNAHFGFFKKNGLQFFTPLFSSLFFQNSLVCFLGFCFFTPRNRILFLFGNIIWVLLLLLFLSYFLRSPDRLVFPAFAFLVFLCLYNTLPWSEGDGQKPLISGFMQKIVLIGLVLLAITALQLHWKLQKNLIIQSEILGDAMNKLRPTDNQLYVIWDSSFPYELMPAFDDFESFRHFHIFSLAASQRSPISQNMLDHFKVKDPLLDIVNNPDIFLICTPKEGEFYRQHMWEKYRMAIRPEKTFDCLFFKVFRILSVKITNPADT